MSSSNRALKVLLIAPSNRITGGQSVQATKLLSILSPVPDLEITFLPIDPQLPTWLQWARRVKFLRTIVMAGFFYSGLLRRIPQADLLHVFTAGLSSYTLWTVPALAFAKLFRKKFVMHYHDGQAEQHITEWRIALPTIKAADRVIVPSGFLVSVFAKYGVKARVISNVVDLDRFVFRERDPLCPHFMTNRMLEPLYNIPCILKAFAIIQSRYENATLVVAHDGFLRQELERLSQELGLRNVSFVGRIRAEEIPVLYEKADVYLTTPNIDNTPGSILECFAAGVPVVATKAGGIPYIAQDRESALLVEVDDHVAVAEAAIELLQNPRLARRLVDRGKFEAQKYHWVPVRNEWIKLYRDTWPRVQ